MDACGRLFICRNSSFIPPLNPKYRAYSPTPRGIGSNEEEKRKKEEKKKCRKREGEQTKMRTSCATDAINGFWHRRQSALEQFNVTFAQCIHERKKRYRWEIPFASIAYIPQCIHRQFAPPRNVQPQWSPHRSPRCVLPTKNLSCVFFSPKNAVPLAIPLPLLPVMRCASVPPLAAHLQRLFFACSF